MSNCEKTYILRYRLKGEIGSKYVTDCDRNRIMEQLKWLKDMFPVCAYRVYEATTIYEREENCEG